jgi:hypothetical protein
MLEFLKVAVPGYTPLHRSTVSSKLNQYYAEYRKNLKYTLEKVQNLAVTTDLWKNRSGGHFMGLTCHFFDDKFNYHSIIIAFRRFYNRHTSENLRTMIQNELQKLDVLDKCSGITTDNASDIKCATKELTSNCVRFSCSAHNINLVIKMA